MTFYESSEGSDQDVLISKLIRVFSGTTHTYINYN